MLFTPCLALALALALLAHASPAPALQPRTSNTDEKNNVQIVLGAARTASASISQAQLTQRRRELKHLRGGNVKMNIMHNYPLDVDFPLDRNFPPDVDLPLDVVFSYAQATPQAGFLIVPVLLAGKASERRQLGSLTYLKAPVAADGAAGLKTEALPLVKDLGRYALPGLKAEGAMLFFDFFDKALQGASQQPAAAAGQQAYAAEVLRQLRATVQWMPM